MSGTGPRENVFATRMALTNTKLRLKGAQTGHSLLAKKRDALTTRFRSILKKVDEVGLGCKLTVLISPVGQTQDGSNHAVGVVLNGGSNLCNRRYILSCPGASQVCQFQSQSKTGERIRCLVARI